MNNDYAAYSLAKSRGDKAKTKRTQLCELVRYGTEGISFDPKINVNKKEKETDTDEYVIESIQVYAVESDSEESNLSKRTSHVGSDGCSYSSECSCSFCITPDSTPDSPETNSDNENI